ncbi:3-hydroxyacyl-CoA dehydrogenase family protein [Ruegeria arenilitoris]|uniref:3-hydroxyacyl-CoA dehydrogenase family protein n=1 Tax=Ruegeria arenilitoris TaxID=1173585 RepID=UPI00147EB4B5|nr:3-hydroxyacyl-CoA dehydrogenase NAD-binding domain-containing protein [Ruegeria arenilitoris]
MVESLNISVIGAGLMGHGIALTFVRVGHRVSIYDPDGPTLADTPNRVANSMRLLGAHDAEVDSALANLKLHDDVKNTVTSADFVIEAAPEKLDLKRSIFSEVESHAPADAILASNTSVIPITKITSHLKRRERALGTHWWNPPHMIPLVEVVKTERTNSDVAEKMFALLEASGKDPVMVEKDVPGFIGNRLQHALWREAISLVANGICSAEGVDNVVKASFGRRLAVLGPLENADLVGIELTQDIHRQVLFDLEASPEPSPYLQELQDKGRTGMAAGRGFREWAKEDLESTKARVSEHLAKLERILPR